jgi:hypothetical protein
MTQQKTVEETLIEEFNRAEEIIFKARRLSQEIVERVRKLLEAQGIQKEHQLGKSQTGSPPECQGRPDDP